jgi:hypothetical protein
MAGDEGQLGPSTRSVQRPIQCDECTIQIGDGYQESVAFRFVDDEAGRSRVLQVCWRCWESLNRRRNKRPSEAGDQGTRPR